MLKNDSDKSFDEDMLSIWYTVQLGVLKSDGRLPAKNAEDNQAYSNSVEKKDRHTSEVYAIECMTIEFRIRACVHVARSRT